MDNEGQTAQEQALQSASGSEVIQTTGTQVTAEPPKAAPAEQKKNEHGCLYRAWRKTSLTDWLIVGLYGGLLWIAIRQATLTTESNSVARDSASAAKTAAEAAKASVELTAKANATSERSVAATETAFAQNKSLAEQSLNNTKKQLRAYVYVSEINIRRAKDDVLEISFHIANAGLTPASEIHCGFNFQFCTGQDAEKLYEQLHAQIQSQGGEEFKPSFLGPNTSIDASKSLGHTSGIFSDANVSRHLIRTEPLYLIGELSYRDVFGDKWPIRFLYVLDNYKDDTKIPDNEPIAIARVHFENK